MSNFNDFTVNNLDYFYKNKININDDNILIKLIKNERNIIKNYIHNNKYNYEINNEKIKDEKINLLKKYCDTIFVDLKIFDLLNNLNNDEYLFYTIKWNNNFIEIIINKIYIDTITNFISRINILIQIIEYFKFKTKKNININIYLILSDLEKKLPPKYEIINPEHVNSGFSNLSFNHKYILIWRLEEFEKVIFHELIHIFDMDCRDQDIHNKFNIIGEHRYYEAITDFWGIFYYIIYISIVTKIQIKLILEIEITFIKNQAMILNDYYDLNSWSSENNNLQDIIIKQNTAALAYYIIKYLIFMYIINNNININNILDNYDNFLNIILKKGLNQENFILLNNNSLRMTLIQFK